MSQTPEWKTEEARQAQILANAIQQAIMTAGNEFEKPMLNAVFGALITCVGTSLAAVPDPHIRKQIIKAMDEALPRAITAALAKAPKAAEVVVIGGIRH